MDRGTKFVKAFSVSVHVKSFAAKTPKFEYIKDCCNGIFAMQARILKQIKNFNALTSIRIVLKRKFTA